MLFSRTLLILLLVTVGLASPIVEKRDGIVVTDLSRAQMFIKAMTRKSLSSCGVGHEEPYERIAQLVREFYQRVSTQKRQNVLNNNVELQWTEDNIAEWLGKARKTSDRLNKADAARIMKEMQKYHFASDYVTEREREYRGQFLDIGKWDCKAYYSDTSDANCNAAGQRSLEQSQDWINRAMEDVKNRMPKQ